MGAQRATKILGMFTRLDRRDGKPQYLRHLPRIERTLARNLAHPSLHPLRAWFETQLPARARRERRSAEARTDGAAMPKTAMVFAAGLGDAHAPDHRHAAQAAGQSRRHAR